LYAATKIEAERRVLAAAGPTLRTVAVRPCWVWGPGDPIFRRIVELARRGRFRWIGASVPVSTTQVDNVVEGVLLAADKGASGQAYFLTDGPPIDSRVFMRALLGTQGMTVSDKQMSYRTARTTATIAEFAWSVLRLSSDVLLDVDSVETTVRPMTVRDDKARKELGYAADVDFEEGLRRLTATPI
jgi:nucleoside-diphosphate-sugar epimerase